MSEKTKSALTMLFVRNKIRMRRLRLRNSGIVQRKVFPVFLFFVHVHGILFTRFIDGSLESYCELFTDGVH